MDETSFLKRPVTIVAIGAGNRANKYLEYAVRHPERLRPVGVVEPNPLRRKALADKFGIDPEHCFADYNRFFEGGCRLDRHSRKRAFQTLHPGRGKCETVEFFIGKHCSFESVIVIQAGLSVNNLMN